MEFVTPEAWMDDALCAQVDPDAFFPEKGGSNRAAKALCASCEVRAQCLAFALAHDERYGIWGGKSERERRRMVAGEERVVSEEEVPERVAPDVLFYPGQGPRVLVPQERVPLVQREVEQLRADVAAARNELAASRREVERLRARLTENEARRLRQLPVLHLHGDVVLVEVDMPGFGRVGVWRSRVSSET